MKKLYTKPQMAVNKFSRETVVTTSAANAQAADIQAKIAAQIGSDAVVELFAFNEWN